MAQRAGDGSEGGVEHLLRLERAGVVGGRAGAQIPHLPGRAVHNRFDEDGTDVEVAAVRLVGAAHGVGEGIVPGALVLDRVTLGEAGGERLDQGTLGRGDAVGEGQGGLGGVIGAGEGAGLGAGVPHLPREVVVGADGVGDAPMGHGAVRVGRQCGLEAVDRLLVVEAEAPVQAAGEPKLGDRGCGGDLAGVGAEIVGVIVHVAFLPSVGRAEANGLWRYCHGRNNLAMSDATTRPRMPRSARHETSDRAPLPRRSRPAATSMVRRSH